MSLPLFAERVSAIKRRIVDVLSTCEVPRLQQQQIHARLGVEVTRAQLTEILMAMHAGRALCFDAPTQEYWMANRLFAPAPDEAIEVVLAKVRELVEVDEEGLAEALPAMRRSAVMHALKRLAQSGRVRVRSVQLARVNGRRTIVLYREARIPKAEPPTVRHRKRKVKAHLNALRALAPEYQGRRV
ncbi:MAG: hypothetical protein IT356_00035 [Gemmatimonadaceae bacterium]|nr:hypothetical protein [Gemmatimonadaceae bacterium]